MGRAWLGAMVSIVSSACGGGDDGLAPPPPTVTAGDVTIETDPLTLRVAGPRGAFEVTAFVEIGTVASVDPSRYYDPRDLDPGVEWTAATRALGVDGDGALVLDNGATLRLVDGPTAGTATLIADAEVDGHVLLRLVLPRDDGEAIFGFGESFHSAVAGGDVREMQFRVDLDSESALNEAHVPVPLALWPARGVGLFVEDPRPGAFDIGAARADRVLATFTRVEPGALHAHLYTADDPLELVRGYVALTAPPAVPPRWAFAPQQWRNVHDSSDQVREDAEAMRGHGIPGSVIWIDNPWQTSYNTFEFDETRFAEPAQLIADLNALGYHVMVWSTPYVNTTGITEADHAEAKQAGFLVTDDVGRPFVFPWQDGPGSLVDFTADGAIAWWQERIARVTELGVVGFKLDFGEDVIPELGGQLTPFRLAGGTAQTMHNAYQRGYHEAYLGALPDGEGFLITRAGSYGEQAVNTAIWPGDLDNDFSRHGVDNGDGERNVGGLPAAVAAGLSLSVSGYPFFGSDIGGFRNGVPTTECLLRWAQYASVGTIMQLGGGGRSHNPWDTELFDAGAVDVYLRYARLHMALFPYLYTLARAAGGDGTPVVRPTRLMHPEAASDDATFYLGDALWTAPVIEEGATTREVVLPPGRWLHWWSGELTEGDGVTARTVAAPLDELPLWLRANTWLALYARNADTLLPATVDTVRSYADPDYGRELHLIIIPDGPPAALELYDGARAEGEAVAGGYDVALTPGAEFDVITLDLDVANGLTEVSETPVITVDGVALAESPGPELCPAPGCYTQLAGRLLIRVWLTEPATVVIR